MNESSTLYLFVLHFHIIHVAQFATHNKSNRPLFHHPQKIIEKTSINCSLPLLLLLLLLLLIAVFPQQLLSIFSPAPTVWTLPCSEPIHSHTHKLSLPVLSLRNTPLKDKPKPKSSAPWFFQRALCPEDTDGFNGLIIEEADVGDDEEQRL